MNYQTYTPSDDLHALIKCHWTLEVPAEMRGMRQRILPDGCVDMTFNYGDDIRRILPDGQFVIQPRTMVLGQMTEAFDVEPTGAVDCFGVRFYPYGFGCVVTAPLRGFASCETPLAQAIGEDSAGQLTLALASAPDTAARIAIVEEYLRVALRTSATIDHVIRQTVDVMLATKGRVTVDSLAKRAQAQRRQLERKFSSRVGISPKQLSKVIRLQAALHAMLDRRHDSLTTIAYEATYYDQSHFIKDFKEFTGVSPSDFLGNDLMRLSSMLYRDG